MNAEILRYVVDGAYTVGAMCGIARFSLLLTTAIQDVRGPMDDSSRWLGWQMVAIDVVFVYSLAFFALLGIYALGHPGPRNQEQAVDSVLFGIGFVVIEVSMVTLGEFCAWVRRRVYANWERRQG